MKIMRNGKEIELTADELFSAYLEQERIYDIQNIKENMSSQLDEAEYVLMVDNKELIEKAADILRRNQDKYDMDYVNALDDAYASVRKFFQARKLWLEFGNVPMHPETEEMESEWQGFPAGTHREEIWHWFEEKFDVCVAEDLMGL